MNGFINNSDTFNLPEIEELRIYAVDIYRVGKAYYIDSVSGDDNNDGLTENTAWETIDKIGYGTYLPGERILFKRGQSFNGKAVFDGLNGIEYNTITIGAYGTGEPPVLNSRKEVSLTWTDQGSNKWTAPFSDVSRLWKDGEEQKRTSNVSFGQAWNEFGKIGGAIWIHDSGVINYYSIGEPTGVFETQTEIYTMYFINSSYVTIENLDMGGNSGATLDIRDSSYFTIRNNKIGKYSDYGITLRACNNFLIERNTFNPSFTLFYSGFGSYTGVDYRGVSDGVYWTLSGGESNYNEVRYNDFINWGHNGILLEASGIAHNNNNLHHNYMSANDINYGRGFTFCGQVNNNEAHHNYFENMVTSNQICGNNNHMYENVFDGVSDSDMIGTQVGNGMSIENYTLPSVDNIIEYNSYLNNEGSAIAFQSSDAAKIMEGNIFRNNLIHNCGEETGIYRSLEIPHYDSTGYNTYTDNAIVWDKTGTNNLIYYRQEYLTVSEFNAKTGVKDTITGNIDYIETNPMYGSSLKKEDTGIRG